MPEVIAIAGGTGHLGRAIADAIKAEGKHKVLVLSRTEYGEEKEKEIGHEILHVDYSYSVGLASDLALNDVTTVISCLNSETPDGDEAEWALFNVLQHCSCVKRYIPSVWGIEYTSEIAPHFPSGESKLKFLRELDSSESLETTIVLNGVFADYFVAPKVPSYFHPLTFAIDIANNTAAIPGSGNVPAVFTHSWDVAKFVARLVDSPTKWEKRSYIIGNKVTWNDFVRIAEEAKGVEFEKTYDDDMEMLQAGKITELPSHREVYSFLPKEVLQGLLASFGVMIEKGLFNFKTERTVNEQFPEVKARTVRELVFAAWG